jgi:hypothetical protein
MDGLTLQVYNWLSEIEESDAAEFLSDCFIDNNYVDELFIISGGDKDISMYDVVIYVPLKKYKTLPQFSQITSKIEEAVRESADSQDIYVRNLEWKARIKTETESHLDKNADIITNLLSQTYVNKQVKLMNQSLKENPHLALGIAKELIETCCKSILIKGNVAFDKDWDILKLVRETNKTIDLIPFEVDNKETTKNAIGKILGGFSNIVHGITELRNSYGSGHGHTPNFKMLDDIYVKLAVTASSELAIFYLTLQNLKEK